MSVRTAVEVTIDDLGEVTVHVHELGEAVRRAALEAVSRALGGSKNADEEAPLSDAEWRRAWDAELAQRVERIDSGAARWTSLDDARLRLRSAAERRR